MDQTKTRHTRHVSSRRILKDRMLTADSHSLSLFHCEALEAKRVQTKYLPRFHLGPVNDRRDDTKASSPEFSNVRKAFPRQALRLPKYLCPNVLQWCDDFVLGFCGHHDGIKFAVWCHLSPSDKENVSTRIHRKAFHWNLCNAWEVCDVSIASDGLCPFEMTYTTTSIRNSTNFPAPRNLEIGYSTQSHRRSEHPSASHFGSHPPAFTLCQPCNQCNAAIYLKNNIKNHQGHQPTWTNHPMRNFQMLKTQIPYKHL